MKKFMKLLVVLVAAFGLLNTVPFENVYAAGNTCDKTVLLGLRPWYYGLTKDTGGDGGCVVDPAKFTGDDLTVSIWKIVLNISMDLSLIVTYAAILFIIYGGFTYIMSNGDTNKVASAKKIITNAVIGLIIALLASVIVNTILTVISAGAT